jgi:ribosomal protein S12 methylthiotransferase
VRLAGARDGLTEKAGAPYNTGARAGFTPVRFRLPRPTVTVPLAGTGARHSESPSQFRPTTALEKIALINLGCPKNLVDAEVMCGHLAAEGYQMTTRPDAADVVVVNTCGFLEAAAQESVDTLLEVARLKAEGRCRAVVAAGCMTQRYGAEIAEALPEVDGFLGVGQAHRLPEVIRRALGGERPHLVRGPAAGFEGYGMRLQATAPWTAYVKVSEGCDRNCSFCVIPSIRGPMASRPVEAVAREVEALVARGVREIILIGQDPTRYGVDRREGHRLVALLERLNAIRELRWIRVMYLFPDRHAGPVLEAIGSLERVCNYVDMPLQHVAEPVLRRMNRPGDGPAYRRLLERLRRFAPDAWVRSTFLVGFPGETARDFAALLDFVREGPIDWLGAFRYSREAGAAAASMEKQVSRRAATRRYEQLMEAQYQAMQQRFLKRIGQQVEALIETSSGQGAAQGRIAGQAPDVDGGVLLDIDQVPDGLPGDFVCAVISGVDGYDLRARAIRRLHRSPRPEPTLLQVQVN